MSLLMDALRKAEESKKQAEHEEQPSIGANPTRGAQLKTRPEPLAGGGIEQEIRAESDVLDASSTNESIPSKVLPNIELEFEEPESARPAATEISEEPVDSELVLTGESDSSGDLSMSAPSSLVDDIRKESKESKAKVKTSLSSLAQKYGKSSGVTQAVRLEPAVLPEQEQESEFPESENNDEVVVEPAQQKSLAEEIQDEEGEESDESNELSFPVQQEDEEELGKAEEKELADSIAVERDKPPLELAVDEAPVIADIQAAKSVFAAKRGPQQRRRRTIVVSSMSVVFMILGAGAYYYYALESGSSFNVPPQVSRQETQALDAVTSTPQAEAVLPSTPVDEPVSAQLALVPEQSSSAAINDNSSFTTSVIIGEIANADQTTAATIEQDVVASDGAALLLSTPSFVEPFPDPASIDNGLEQQDGIAELGSAVLPATIASGAASEPINLISFSRRESDSTIDPLASEAFNAFQAGDIEEAGHLYRKILTESPNNRDALLGLAAIALRDDEPLTAMGLYSRLLARDPSDPVARAGILEITPSGSPADQERQLKRLANLHPNVATLPYALGNFYASRQRWSEAQQAYFNALSIAKMEALSGGNINPDYAFNLAVSLEHLNQVNPAMSFYREALEYSSNYPPSFNQDTVRSRLQDMSRELVNE